jgi:hypothetical protein
MPTPLKMQMTSVTVQSVSREKNRKEMKREDKIITVPTDVNVSPFALPEVLVVPLLDSVDVYPSKFIILLVLT